MKKTTIFTLLTALIMFNLNAQITFNKRYSNNFNTYPLVPYVDKLGVSGHKIVFINQPAKNIELYNMNHSLFKSIAIPTTALPNGNVLYITETLFDTDALVEFIYQGVTGTNPNLVYKFYIYKETGAQVFFRDSAQLTVSTNWNNVVNNTEPIFFDGSKTVMRLSIGFGTTAYEYFTLPGHLPCAPCTETVGTVGKAEVEKTASDPLFYPNPANKQLKLKYELPADYKNAVIEVHDLQGKLIEEFQVTNQFDCIYIPESYNNGLYIYTLIVDQKVVRREKILIGE